MANFDSRWKRCRITKSSLPLLSSSRNCTTSSLPLLLSSRNCTVTSLWNLIESQTSHVAHINSCYTVSLIRVRRIFWKILEYDFRSREWKTCFSPIKRMMSGGIFLFCMKHLIFTNAFGSLISPMDDINTALANPLSTMDYKNCWFVSGTAVCRVNQPRDNCKPIRKVLTRFSAQEKTNKCDAEVLARIRKFFTLWFPLYPVYHWEAVKTFENPPDGLT